MSNPTDPDPESPPFIPIPVSQPLWKIWTLWNPELHHYLSLPGLDSWDIKSKLRHDVFPIDYHGTRNRKKKNSLEINDFTDDRVGKPKLLLLSLKNIDKNKNRLRHNYKTQHQVELYTFPCQGQDAPNQIYTLTLIDDINQFLIPGLMKYPNSKLLVSGGIIDYSKKEILINFHPSNVKAQIIHVVPKKINIYDLPNNDDCPYGTWVDTKRFQMKYLKVDDDDMILETIPITFIKLWPFNYNCIGPRTTPTTRRSQITRRVRVSNSLANSNPSPIPQPQPISPRRSPRRNHVISVPKPSAASVNLNSNLNSVGIGSRSKTSQLKEIVNSPGNTVTTSSKANTHERVEETEIPPRVLRSTLVPGTHTSNGLPSSPAPSVSISNAQVKQRTTKPASKSSVKPTNMDKSHPKPDQNASRKRPNALELSSAEAEELNKRIRIKPPSSTNSASSYYTSTQDSAKDAALDCVLSPLSMSSDSNSFHTCQDNDDDGGISDTGMGNAEDTGTGEAEDIVTGDTVIEVRKPSANPSDDENSMNVQCSSSSEVGSTGAVINTDASNSMNLSEDSFDDTLLYGEISLPNPSDFTPLSNISVPKDSNGVVDLKCEVLDVNFGTDGYFWISVSDSTTPSINFVPCPLESGDQPVLEPHLDIRLNYTDLEKRGYLYTFLQQVVGTNVYYYIRKVLITNSNGPSETVMLSIDECEDLTSIFSYSVGGENVGNAVAPESEADEEDDFNPIPSTSTSKAWQAFFK